MAFVQVKMIVINATVLLKGQEIAMFLSRGSELLKYLLKSEEKLFVRVSDGGAELSIVL